MVPLFLVACLSSCAPIYIPSSPVYFGHTKEKEWSASANLGSQESSAMLAYALPKGINVGMGASIKTGSSYTINSPNSSTTEIGLKGMQPQLLLGYRNRLTASHLIEINTGASMLLPNLPQDVKGGYSVFIQPSLLFNDPLSRVHFYSSIKGNYAVLNLQDGQEETSVKGTFIEPSFQFVFGSTLKMTTTLGYSIATVNNYPLRETPLILKLGLRYNLKPKKTETPEKLPNL